MGYQIYTDGSCLRNPEGPGGWAWLILDDEGQEVARGAGGESRTTNNRMELTAAIEGLSHALKNPPANDKIRILSDSQYVINGITDWIDGWKRRGWKTASKDPVKNAELWRLLDELNGRRRIEWTWVRGHNGNRWNEIVDEMAVAESRRLDFAA